ncbi:motility associated factor glycosyltransferase family protein [Endozoicomonas arenosclerae]|uniref:motility associated factor glycosyltransferase family protein n=1 Tax=Endozoicomonas arenosclerae TaxID=1633495 RepID=UPI000780407D|nr:6-hydroxymethylpterin diphosphokinase MptE-like protein [Endozoicomonas arenosclerae]
MSELFEKNIQVIEDRWPELAEVIRQQDLEQLDAHLVTGANQTISVNNVQLSSRHNRLHEAMLQAAMVPEESAVAFLYGTGMGDIQDELLKRSQLSELHVRIMNEAIFSLVMHYTDQTHWLEDPRVDLASAAVFRDIEKPYFAIPSDLVLASEVNITSRNQLWNDCNDEYMNRPFKKDNPEFNERLNENISLIEQDQDVSEWFDSAKGRNAYIIASGPTLEDNYEHILRQKESSNPPLIISVDTAFIPLIEHGIRPDIVVSIDYYMTAERLGSARSGSIPLVYFPLVTHDALSTWQGPRFCAYSVTELFESIRESHPKGDLFTYGSVVHPAIDLAVKMGVKSVSFFGADFSYPGGESHAHWKNGTLTQHSSKAQHWVLNGKGEKVPSQPNLISYLVGVEYYIRMHPSISFFNSSLKGAQIEGAVHYKSGEMA